MSTRSESDALMTTIMNIPAALIAANHRLRARLARRWFHHVAAHRQVSTLRRDPAMVTALVRGVMEWPSGWGLGDYDREKVALHLLPQDMKYNPKRRHIGGRDRVCRPSRRARQ